MRRRNLGETHSLDAIKHELKNCGSHFFDKDTMRFFRSRVSNKIHPTRDGALFVTSEQYVGGPSSGFAKGARKFTVRKFVEGKCSADTVGEFQQFKTSEAAHRFAAKLAKKR